MARRRVLLLLKPLDVYPPRPSMLPSSSASSSSFPSSLNPKIISYLNSRCKVHKDTIRFCQDVLQSKYVEWEPVTRDNLCRPIRHVDLVITIGGDGTLLRASHFLDDSIPVLGVNSDPTQVEEVNELSDTFDATRSTGYLCAATAKNFEQVLDDVLEGRKQPSELARISIHVNGNLFPTYALNDILVAHPCPATVSRFSFRIEDDRTSSSLVSSRSSGLRISTAAGSTAAILSAGGIPMPISSQDLQYMVREPISPRVAEVPLLQGFVKPEQVMLIDWYTQEGVIYVDGCHVTRPLQYGNKVEVSAKAPILKVYLPREFSRDCSVTYHQPQSEL
ncbi:putative NADH kinase isoform X2 [Curcuma longa]|uniref:putative NADH kinase isoform X2 n=1 Tax=Curcuma longa TaxID=136217 RepID=UPI003D9DC989